MRLNDFKPAEPWSNNRNILNQMSFGYVYVKSSKAVIYQATPKVITNPYSLDDALNDLFIDKARLKQMLNLFKVKKNLILQGPPGVGKTFFAKRIAYAFLGEQDISRVSMVQFHQSYSYEDFIQGYRPTDDGAFTLKDGLFYQFCKRAQEDPDHNYVFIIDEINRGNLSKIFGEVMMLIESDKRGEGWGVPLTYAKSLDSKFFIPKNVHLLGLMNTADRSLSIVDYALRRRFAFMDLKPAFMHDGFNEHLINNGASPGLVEKIITRMAELNDKIITDKDLGSGFCVGHSFFCPAEDIKALDNEWYENIVRSEILPLISEYWFDKTSEEIDEMAVQLLEEI